MASRVINYEDKYAPDIHRLIEDYYWKHLQPYFPKFDHSVLARMIREGVHEDCFLMEVDEKIVGIMYGKVEGSKIDDSKFYLQQVWYTMPQYGYTCMRLVNDVMKMLKERGFTAIVMSVLETPVGERLEKLIQYRGYRKMETHYIKAL